MLAKKTNQRNTYLYFNLTLEKMYHVKVNFGLIFVKQRLVYPASHYFL
jgi:hypothetical protein